MNLFDLVVVLLAFSAMVGGYRLGLLARALSWAGMALGLIVTARFLPRLVEVFDGPDPTGRLLVAVAFLLGGAFVGQAIGLVIGAKAHLALPAPSRPVDRAGGAGAGLAGVLVALWLLIPSMAEVPGTIALQVRSSAIAQAIDSAAPSPPDTLQTLRRLVGENQFPQVFSALTPAPDVGPPPSAVGIDQAVLDRAVASSVRVEGEACGRLQEGSGFVAEAGIVVTNAHVVAGEDETELVGANGRRVAATVVHFDPDRDLAVLSAPGLDAPPLPIGDAGVGAEGAVLGYPGGGPLDVSPFAVREEVQAVGRDLYDSHSTRRQVLVLASDLAPGDSGAALVDPAGSVVGVAFAIAPDRPGTAYALATEELRTALAAPRAQEAATGGCLR